MTAEEFLAANQSGELDLNQLGRASGGFRLKDERHYPATNPGKVQYVDP